MLIGSISDNDFGCALDELLIEIMVVIEGYANDYVATDDDDENNGL